MRAVQTLGLLIAALGASAPARAAIDLDAVAAWDGWSRPGRATELRLSLVSDRAGKVTLDVVAGNQRISATTTVEAGTRRQLVIPIAAAEHVQVNAAAHSGGTDTSDTTLALSESPLLAAVGASAQSAAPEGFHRIDIEPGAVPRESAAFSSIDALAIDVQSLSALDDRQMAALLDHVGRCGPTVLIGATAAEADVFEGAVGCGGRKLAAVLDPAEAASALKAILSASTRAIPDQRMLSSMAGPSLAAWNVALALLTAAGAAMLLTALFTSSLLAVVAVSAASAIAILWIVQSQGVDSSLLVWSETGSGERVAQYTALQRNTLMRRGEARIPIAATLARPRFCGNEAPATWSWDGDTNRFTTVALEQRLFGSVAICYEGQFPLARSAAIETAGDDKLTIRNSGSSQWPAGTVAWNGGLHRIGKVSAGQSVTIESTGGLAPADTVEREAVSRVPFDGAAVLWPLDLSSTAGLPARAHAWVLMHIDGSGATT